VDIIPKHPTQVAPLNLSGMSHVTTAGHLMPAVFTLMGTLIVLFAITTHTVMANLLYTFIKPNVCKY
jgi:hypothetical protein